MMLLVTTGIKARTDPRLLALMPITNWPAFDASVDELLALILLAVVRLPMILFEMV